MIVIEGSIFYDVE